MITPIFEKKALNKPKFYWIVLLFKHFFELKLSPIFSEQEKKRLRIYDLLNVETKPKSLCPPYTKQTFYLFIYFFLQKKELLEKKVTWRIEQKRKEGFLTALTTVIKKNPTTSIRRHANELKVHEKAVRTAIKEDFSPDHHPLALYGAF